MKPPVVITGPQGSGKTTVSNLIACRLGYRVRNVGDILQEELYRHGVYVAERAAIGRCFLAVVGVERYFSLVEAISQEATVIDGLRSSDALELVRRTHPSLLHVHRLGISSVGGTTARDAGEQMELARLRDMAEVRMAWLARKQDLEEQVTEALKSIRNGSVR